MRIRSFIIVTTLAVLAAVSLGASPAAGSQGSLAFHVTVSGKGHDSGTISAAESGTDIYGVTGCAIIKQKAGSLFGAYTYVVRKVVGPIAVQEAGIKPLGPAVYLEIDHFRPGAATSTYRVLDVSGSFAVNGHSYGGGATSTSIARISDGGRSGTWTEPKGHRNYPAKIAQSIPGFSFKATWTCSTVFHLTAQ